MNNGNALPRFYLDAAHLPGEKGDPGRSAADKGVLWIARVGSAWRDLPATFGKWNAVLQRFRRWALRGVFERMFKVLSGDRDFEYALIHRTIIRVHQHGTGAKWGLKIRRSGVRAAA
jgi:transposase